MKYLLCSITLHLGLLLAWQWSCGAHEYGLVPDGREGSRAPAFPVTLIAASMPAPAPPAPSARREADGGAAPIAAKAAAAPAPVHPSAAIPETGGGAIVPAGRLTRLPRPAADVDLDVPELKRINFAGRVELDLLIETDGAVSEVTPTEQSELTRLFTELVAARFKAARFHPGEIDGRAVRSRLRITVVSEFTAPPDDARQTPQASSPLLKSP